MQGVTTMIYRTNQHYVQGSNAVDMSAEIAQHQRECGTIIDWSDIEQRRNGSAQHTARHAANSDGRVKTGRFNNGMHGTYRVSRAEESNASAASISERANDTLSFREHVRRFADSSDMICSLRYEDVRGISLGPSSKRDVALFSVVSIAIAVVSIVVGA